ncbi:N-acetylglucosamine-1-phosphodiester alpha-N-acetylglucosaminidase-like [Branchiostoma lanceolatum]|uniref:N-acetylglucosamine-1-phosphodiester alpha-N-acetylglucosaminidase-like n=1 Tax=Branchiostoma lanceolatum TaxID=7740 RepID=UPI003453DAAB
MAGYQKTLYILIVSVFITVFVITTNNNSPYFDIILKPAINRVSRRSADRFLIPNKDAPVKGERSSENEALLPFSQSEEWHRHVNGCRTVKYGDTDHETFPGHKNSSVASSSNTKYFVDKLLTSRGHAKDVYGHRTVINNPLRSFSVVEPGGPNGCVERRRSTAVKTSRARGCHAAVNAGFFGSESGACMGNVVTDGKRIQDGGGIKNANFGIRKDGTIVVGYLSEMDVLREDNPFVQLVTGVIWLVRNGTVYVNESKAQDCAGLQEYGPMDKFVNVLSARVAVGHDVEGRVVLVQIDGNTEERGLSLWEFAEFLLSLGVVNAINLDGGGSVTFVLDGTVANYPADHW